MRDRLPTRTDLVRYAKIVGVCAAFFIFGMAWNHAHSPARIETRTVTLEHRVEVPGPTVTVQTPATDACRQLADMTEQYTALSVMYTEQRSELEDLLRDISSVDPVNQQELNKYKKRLDDLTASTERTDKQLADMKFALDNQVKECRG